MAKSLDIIDPKKELEDRPREEKDEFDQGFKEPSSGGGGIFYLIIGIIAVIVAVASALYILYKSDRGTKEEAAETATPTQTITVQVSPSPVSSVTVSSPVSTFKYTNEKIRVANGNGIPGEAAKIKGVLEDKGFKIESVGNASKTYTETTIFYKTGQEDLANALKDAIKSYYVGTIENSDSTVGTYDAVIALGSK